ncbi:ATP-binding protein [Streptomyces bathyalis]|uniref:ATP-binding protein n=1 Tax=Streptomyces bathyalis TaxID=2710756 RepID=A0A7T1T346_9ACTN|nr:ATP-binding protein [Streptomyces bathyalis]QPP05522.1 ATP-binding protein [Streptomyces bathyalis]
MNREITPTEPELSATMRHSSVLLSATRRGARLARRLTVQQLTEWQRPFGAAEQITAELASNAVLHGRLPGRSFRLTLTLHTSGTLRIAVADPRPEWEPRTSGSRDPAAESGRGLLIVEALADRWGVDFSVAQQKSVWAELDLCDFRDG